MRQTKSITDKPQIHNSKVKLLAGGVAGLAVLGLGQGAAFAAEGHGSAHRPHATVASAPMTSAMPTATPKRTGSTPAPNYSASVGLQAMPAGTVHFRYRGTTLEASISAFGLTPGSTHLAQITFGDGRTPIAFTQFTASPTGQVDTTVTSLQPLPRLPEGATFQIELSTSPGQPIAVTPVPHGPGHFVNQAQRLQAIEAAGEGNLAGHASVSYNAGTQTLTVRVVASGFAPDTNHAAHVHMGSCMLQGAPVYMLEDLHADGHGQIDQTDVLHNVTSFTTPAGGWYLNIHEGTSATILDAAGNPTPLFRPLLCSDLPPSSATSASAGNQSQQSASPGMGMTGSSANNGGQSGSQASATGASTTTTLPSGGDATPMPSGGSATPPASGESGTSARPQLEVLPAALQPVGTSNAGGQAQVKLQPSTGQACATVEVSGVTGITEAQIDGPDGPVVSFSLQPGGPDQTFTGCTAIDSATLSGIEANPANFQLQVPVPGQSAQTLAGALEAHAPSD